MSERSRPLAAEWWRGAVLYQIYPRSFLDSDGDGVGDLKGIVQKLDYVASLGVDGVWISPFFASPMKDFGYDVSDYRAVDPVFGTLADFDALLARAHELGLKVIIDQVWSHSSDQHPWFQESRASRGNPKADWYVWADAKPDGSPPNNWQAVFGGASWSWEPRRRQYYLHNFLVEQPDLNFHSPAVQDAILEVARFWLERGVDGFRLDVINFLTHDPALTDNPPRALAHPAAQVADYQQHLHDRSQPQTLAFLARLRALTDQHPGVMTLGEIVDEELLARQQEYVAGADRLSTAYSFYLLNAKAASAELFLHALASWEGAEGWPSWSLGNHDVPRFPTRLAGDDPAKVRQLLAILVSLRGSAFLYQGDELGLPQAEVAPERLRDPFARRNPQLGAWRDGVRTPHPWKATAAQAGFTTAREAWLPVDPRHAALAVDGQEADPGSMLAFTRALLAFRRQHPALRTGDLRLMPADPDVLAFSRTLGNETLICLFNMGEAPCRAAGGGRLAYGLGGARLEGGEIFLPPASAAFLIR